MSFLSSDEFMEAIKGVKLLALDVDGVLTDDSIYFGPDRMEFKKFNISDGFFMVLAMRAGLELAVVSGRFSEATESRMADLGIKHVMQGMKSKVGMIAPLIEKLQISFEDVAFVGNEILDIPLARKVGLPIAVADAADRLKSEVKFVTANKGGHGAVREIVEYYLKAKNIDPMDHIL